MTERENWTDAARGHDRPATDDVDALVDPANADDTVTPDGVTPDNLEVPSLPDLSAMQADDALLDALGGSDPQVADGLGDQELNALLLAWRRDIDSEPLADLVSTDTAVTTIQTAALAKRHRGSGRKRRMLVPVAAAAAVLAIAFTGTGIAARDAQPGDTLWGLTKVLYADQARSTEAAVSARTDLEAAKLALSQGNLDEARKMLEAAELAMGSAAQADLEQLRAQHQALTDQLVPAPPSSSSQPSPTTPPTLPSSPDGQQPLPTTPPVDTRPTQPDPDQTTTTTPDPTDDPTTTTPPPTSTTETPSSGEGSVPGSGTGTSGRQDTPLMPQMPPPQ